MAKSKSSRRWLDEHFSDEFVQRAQQEGYRGRAVYKLKELDKRFELLKPGMQIVDLGSAPGAWSEYVSQRLKGKGHIIATDILPMDSVPDVEFIQGDFHEIEVVEKIMKSLQGQRVNLVISDIAPNLSGMDAVDQPRAMYLAELAQDFAHQVLISGGNLLVKAFQGDGFDAFIVALRDNFSTVTICKPKASRPRSREVYVLARRYKL